MAKKSLAYDNEAYRVPVVYSSGIAAGANGVTQKFAAFTAQKIKSVVICSNVVGTTASTPLLYSKSGTTTSTSTLTAIGSAAVLPSSTDLATAITLAAGDQFWVTHGTDATMASSVAIETYAIAGANLTV